MYFPLFLAFFAALCYCQSSSDGFSEPPASGKGPIWRIGETHTLRWSIGWPKINLILFSSFVMEDGNSNIIRILSNADNPGTIDWTIPSDVDLSQGSSFFLVVYEVDDQGNETNNNIQSTRFTITPGPSSAAPTITQEVTLSNTGVTVTIIARPTTRETDTPTADTTSTTDSTMTDADAITTSGAPPPAAEAGMPHSTVVGLGAGLGLGIPIVAVAVAGILLLLFRRRRGSDADAAAPIYNGHEPTVGVYYPEMNGGQSLHTGTSANMSNSMNTRGS